MDNVVVGHLCQDPVLRQTRREGKPVASFTVAVNPRRRVGEAFIERPPVFHRVVCFGVMAENVNNSLRKGMEVFVMGEWVDDSYSDEQGQRRVQVAMEARTVGPALRWATAEVRKVPRTGIGADRPDTTRVTDITTRTARRAEPASTGAPPTVAGGSTSGMQRRKEARPEPATARGG
jgi:single stranded DNA-binding protein